MCVEQPKVSIIIPAYFSGKTIEASLQSFCQQDYENYEVIVVNSSRDGITEERIRKKFPQVRIHHPSGQLLPHAARNVGVTYAKGELFIFTDPDIYAPPSWIRLLVNGFEKYGGVIVGSLSSYGNRWFEMGMHLCKFDSWLPGGEVRPIDISPTANMLCSRADFEAVGGFDGRFMLGDTKISWMFTAKEISIQFVPAANVAHHHFGDFTGLLRERYARGKEFAEMRVDHFQWDQKRVTTELLKTISLLRFFSFIRRGFRSARQAKMGLAYLWVSPVILVGHAAWLAGEAAYYLRPQRDR
jgi:glycosyltransferase involved in cell wall biosynthesis